jgi:hypothetical protein
MIKSKTGEPGCFEVTETTRLSLERWIGTPEMIGVKFLCPDEFIAVRACLPSVCASRPGLVRPARPGALRLFAPIQCAEPR